MFRSLARSAVVASCLVLFLSSAPARALPLAGETEDFSWSLSELWERLVEPIVALWTSGGTCTPGSGGGGATTNGAGMCDPNG